MATVTCGQPDPTGCGMLCTQPTGHAGAHSYALVANKNPADPTYANAKTFPTVYYWGP